MAQQAVEGRDRAGGGRRRTAVVAASVLLAAALSSGLGQAPAEAAGAATPASLGFSGRAGDFDGNGKDDIASFTRGLGADVYVARSDGTQFVGIGDLWDDSFAAWSQAPLTGDFNGDGKSDVAAFTREDSAEVAVALSTGHSFGPAAIWRDAFAPAPAVPAVGDFNGDGKDDVVAFDRRRSGKVTVALSTGRSFGPSTTWAGSFVGGSAIPEVGDFNGDGKADIAMFTRGGSSNVYVALSTGRSFTRPGPWHGRLVAGSALPAVGDVNGDGKDDVIAFDRGRSGRVTVALSTGRSFRLARAGWLDSFATDDAVPGVGDFNGDGKDDIAAFTRGGTADVYVGLSTGRSFRLAPDRWHEYFAAATEIPQPGVLW
jgi:hypothetical protein